MRLEGFDKEPGSINLKSIANRGQVATNFLINAHYLLICIAFNVCRHENKKPTPRINRSFSQWHNRVGGTHILRWDRNIIFIQRFLSSLELIYKFNYVNFSEHRIGIPQCEQPPYAEKKPKKGLKNYRFPNRNRYAWNKRQRKNWISIWSRAASSHINVYWMRWLRSSNTEFEFPIEYDL